jgi:hypothetical protein
MKKAGTTRSLIITDVERTFRISEGGLRLNQGSLVIGCTKLLLLLLLRLLLLVLLDPFLVRRFLGGGIGFVDFLAIGFDKAGGRGPADGRGHGVRGGDGRN